MKKPRNIREISVTFYNKEGESICGSSWRGCSTKWDNNVDLTKTRGGLYKEDGNTYVSLDYKNIESLFPQFPQWIGIIKNIESDDIIPIGPRFADSDRKFYLDSVNFYNEETLQNKKILEGLFKRDPSDYIDDWKREVSYYKRHKEEQEIRGRMLGHLANLQEENMKIEDFIWLVFPVANAYFKFYNRKSAVPNYPYNSLEGRWEFEETYQAFFVPKIANKDEIEEFKEYMKKENESLKEKIKINEDILKISEIISII